MRGKRQRVRGWRVRGEKKGRGSEVEDERVRGWRVNVQCFYTQQSIFLVVIIESFADLRSQTAIGPTSQQKQKNQPHFVRDIIVYYSILQYTICIIDQQIIYKKLLPGKVITYIQSLLGTCCKMSATVQNTFQVFYLLRNVSYYQ